MCIRDSYQGGNNAGDMTVGTCTGVLGDAYLNNMPCHLYTSEDIVKMDDRSVQRFVRDCDTRDIVLALKGANREVAEKLLSLIHI